jgi:hypothetical protein
VCRLPKQTVCAVADQANATRRENGQNNKKENVYESVMHKRH